jgi:hypothetical protein
MMACPFCGRTSHNPHDADQRWCDYCKVFADDVLAASPAVRKSMGVFHRKLAERFPEKAESHLRSAAVWEGTR